MSRKRSRQVILQKLYRDEFHENSTTPTSNFVFQDEKLNSQDSQFAIHILNGIKKQKLFIDKLISKHAHNWKFKRLSLVDLNIMRMAIFEILFLKQVPDKVALNEAVELAKQFSSKNSSSFINGILDQILKQEKLQK